MHKIKAVLSLRHGWERRYQRQKAAERLWLGLARRLPRRLRYWAFVSVGADATTSGPLRDAVVPEVRFMDVLGAARDRLGVH